MGGGKPARLFLLNGFFYYLNNQMNFLVLEKVPAAAAAVPPDCLPPPSSPSSPRPRAARGPRRTALQVDAVTHGLINCGRRVANILFAIVWFRIPPHLYRPYYPMGALLQVDTQCNQDLNQNLTPAINSSQNSTLSRKP